MGLDRSESLQMAERYTGRIKFEDGLKLYRSSGCNKSTSVPSTAKSTKPLDSDLKGD